MNSNARFDHTISRMRDLGNEISAYGLDNFLALLESRLQREDDSTMIAHLVLISEVATALVHVAEEP